MVSPKIKLVSTLRSKHNGAYFVQDVKSVRVSPNLHIIQLDQCQHDFQSIMIL